MTMRRAARDPHIQYLVSITGAESPSRVRINLDGGCRASVTEPHRL